jgi:glycosyltransferase involved in cell wall biosynthesis
MAHERSIPSALEAAVAHVQGGGEIDLGVLTELLCRESRAERSTICAELAQVYLRAGRLEQAGEFAERAWLLSEHAPELLPAYLEVQAARGDVEAARAAHKRVGMRYATAGDITAALMHFNLHHYAYQQAGQGDRYDYDLDILNAIEHLAQPYRPHGDREPGATHDRGRIRVAYLVFGATHSESVIVRLLCSFARFHDRKRFDARFFVPDRRPLFEERPLSRLLDLAIKRLENNGAAVFRTTATGYLESLLETAANMRQFRPHLLVTAAALADYAHYFLACTRPAPVRLGLVYGPPEQYVPPGFDWVVTATRHPLIDSPSDGTLVPIEVELSDRRSIDAASRAEFAVPETSVLIMIVGRSEKLIDRAYWVALSDLLSRHANAFLLAVGANDRPDFLDEVLAPQVRARVKIVGYRADYLRILAMADIVLDTFPSGGGVVLLDAMALQTPVLTFRNDYARRFDQRRWSPGEELFDVGELVVPRGDFAAFVAAAGRLVADPEHRRRMGEACRESVQRLNGQPGRMVARHERVYQDVLNAFRRGQSQRSENKPIGLPVAAPAIKPALTRARRLLEFARRVGVRGWRYVNPRRTT